ncbi:MAG: AraC family transcriptional regulator [Bacteroidetes bacterium]|nr:MAG: AraC family transcriptional regulator [Bacteroidota bacterium]
MKRIEEKVKYSHVEIKKDKSFFFDHVHIVWDEQITFHQSDEWEITYIITGSGTRVIGDAMETFSKGEIILLPPKLPHGWYFDEYDHDDEGKIENITIIFPDALLEKCSGTFPETKAAIKKFKNIDKGMSLKGVALEKVQYLMLSMTTQNDMEQLSTLILILFQIACSDEMHVVGFREKQSRSTLKMQEIHRFILTHYHRKISLDEAASYIGMNRSSFCTFFKKEKGKTFFETLNEYRINCACLMLRETLKPVSEICFAVGFNDIPYFNRTFKKFKGVTPKNYREASNKS